MVENILKEVFLTVPTFQAQIASHSGVFVEKEKKLYALPLRKKGAKRHWATHDPDARHKDIYFWSQLWFQFHIWIFMGLFYKMRQNLLHNATAILFQDTTKIYFRMRQFFYYKKATL